MHFALLIEMDIEPISTGHIAWRTDTRALDVLNWYPRGITKRILLAIQRGNAACILGTLPHVSGIDQVYHL